MAIENDSTIAPDDSLSKRSLPAPLRKVIENIFTENASREDFALVGGTSLAGYYAGHRRSDDIDLFTKNSDIQEQLTRFVKSLPAIGLNLDIKMQHRGYFKALAVFEGYHFTIDVVEDGNLFSEGVGEFRSTKKGILVPSPTTLLKVKAATLVSRCSEKDLFDLIWLTGRLGSPTPEEWSQLGSQIDAGVSIESILSVLTTTKLRPEACDFAESHTLHLMSREEVFAKISAYQTELIDKFRAHLEISPVQHGAMSELVTEVRELDRRNDGKDRPLSTIDIRRDSVSNKTSPSDMCEHCKARPREKGRKKYCSTCGKLSDAKKLV